MVIVLAIGAHPDDIELGCSATLIRHKNNGAKIYLLVLTKGEASGDAKIREKECKSSAELMGAEKLFFGGLNDTEIDDGIKTIMVIERVIDEVNPDMIYTHSYKDTHQDHRNTSYATLSAGRKCKKIFMYESPTTFLDFSPKVYVDIIDEFELKKKIIRLFKSQHNKNWYSIGHTEALAVEGLAAHRGFQASVRVAEAFEVAKLIISRNEFSYYRTVQ